MHFIMWWTNISRTCDIRNSIPKKSYKGSFKPDVSGCIKSTQITQTTQIFANKICTVEYDLQNFNSIRLRQFAHFVLFAF